MTPAQKEREALIHYEMLKAQIRYHKFHYYVMNAGVILDYEFDKMVQHFNNLCDQIKEEFPALWQQLGQPEGVWVDSKDYV